MTFEIHSFGDGYTTVIEHLPNGGYRLVSDTEPLIEVGPDFDLEQFKLDGVVPLGS